MKASEIKLQKDMEKASEYLGSKIVNNNKYHDWIISDVSSKDYDDITTVDIKNNITGQINYLIFNDLPIAIAVLKAWTTPSYDEIWEYIKKSDNGLNF